MPKDRGSEKDLRGSDRDRDKEKGSGKERVHGRLTGLVRRRSSSSSSLLNASLHEVAEPPTKRDPMMQEFAEQSRKDTLEILQKTLPETVERLGAVYKALVPRSVPEDTEEWAAMWAQVLPEILKVRNLLATVSMCFTLGVKNVTFQDEVLSDVSELTRTLTDLVSDISPLSRSNTIAEFKSVGFVLNHIHIVL